MDRLRELRGPDTRERDLANILGFEHSRAVRWKEGQMYVDRAEYLLRLADSLEVEPMLLVGIAAGVTSLPEAQRQLQKIGKTTDELGKRRGRVSEPTEGRDSGRGTVVLISANAEGETELREVVGRHPDVALTVASSLSAGVAAAERFRPDLIFLDLGLANVQAFDAIRVLSALTTRSQRRTRVVTATSTVTDEVEKPALMAGAAAVSLFPFARHVFDSELDRLEERLGPRKPSKKS
jgi:CheY-like chemotaxis protein